MEITGEVGIVKELINETFLKEGSKKLLYIFG
ncbi:MAG: hypothetical protein ACI9GH_000203 [Candidatus Paceibacteria bacterium]